jgi:hypothetical protein
MGTNTLSIAQATVKKVFNTKPLGIRKTGRP